MLELSNVERNHCLAIVGVSAVEMAIGRNAEGMMTGFFDTVLVLISHASRVILQDSINATSSYIEVTAPVVS